MKLKNKFKAIYQLIHAENNKTSMQ